MAKLPISPSTVNTTNITDLTPLVVGQAPTLQPLFDKGVLDTKTYINSTLLPELNGNTGSKKIGHTSASVVADNAGEAIEETASKLLTHKSSSDHDGRYYTETEVNALLLANQQGNHTGLWQGLSPALADPGIAAVVEEHTRQISDMFVNVKDFGAVGDGFSDDTIAIQSAIDTGKKILIPKGTYLCNVIIPTKVIIEGVGNTESILKAFNVNNSIITYTSKSPYWTYHSEIRNIKFESNNKTGVGFTFSKTNPSDYALEDELSGNVKFYGCLFSGLYKGVQFPFGNIGSEFYSCAFNGNKYGVYSINNKFGSVMHAGNKYFFAGELSNNDCAIYIHNTANGFGGFDLKNTIMYNNKICLYLYTTSNFGGVVFDDVWLEANGTLLPGTAVEIDNWLGSTLSLQSLNRKTIILDGSKAHLTVRDGFFSDATVKGDNNSIHVIGSTVERGSSNNGGECIVEESTSHIIIENPLFNEGSAFGINILNKGVLNHNINTIDSQSTYSNNRSQTIPKKMIKNSNSPNFVASVPFNTVVTTGLGSFNLTPTLVNDGVLYKQCCEYTRLAFATNELTACEISAGLRSLTLGVGWYVYSQNIKIVSGVGVGIAAWNRSTSQFHFTKIPSTNGRWITIGGFGYSPGGQTIYPIDFAGLGGDVTWRTCDFQLTKFETKFEAQEFLSTLTYVES